MVPRHCQSLSVELLADTSQVPARVPPQESSDVEELTLFLTDSVTAGTEGLIVKSLDSTYEPSKCAARLV